MPRDDDMFDPGSTLDSGFLFGSLQDEDEPEDAPVKPSSKKKAKPKRRKLFSRGSGSAAMPSLEDVERYGFGEDEDPFVGVADEESAPDSSPAPQRKRKRKKKPVVAAPPPVDEFGADVLDEDDDFGVSDDAEEVPKKRKKQSVMLIGVVLLMLCGVIITVAMRMDSGVVGGEEPTVAQSTGRTTATPVVPELEPSATTPSVPVATTNESVGVTVSSGMSDEDGVNRGDHSSGTDAIFGYDWAYYGLRSDSAANEFSVNKDNKGIADKVAAGTVYELEVTPRVIGERYDATLTLIAPGGEPKEYEQVFTVQLVDGKYLVKSVETLS